MSAKATLRRFRVLYAPGGRLPSRGTHGPAAAHTAPSDRCTLSRLPRRRSSRYSGHSSRPARGTCRGDSPGCAHLGSLPVPPRGRPQRHRRRPARSRQEAAAVRRWPLPVRQGGRKPLAGRGLSGGCPAGVRCLSAGREGRMEPAEGLEPSTPALRKPCSAVELRWPGAPHRQGSILSRHPVRFQFCGAGAIRRASRAEGRWAGRRGVRRCSPPRRDGPARRRPGTPA